MDRNLEHHPEIPELLAYLESTTKAHEKNQKIASGLIIAGTCLISTGVVIATIETLRQKLAR